MDCYSEFLSIGDLKVLFLILGGVFVIMAVSWGFCSFVDWWQFENIGPRIIKWMKRR